MSILIKNKKLQILSISFVCTLIIFFLKNSDFYSNSYLRNLISDEEITKRCEKTEKDFLNKYNQTEYPETFNITLDRYQDVLKQIFQEKKFGLIKKYLPRIFIFFIFLIVDIFLIVIWIIFCSCSCGKKQKSPYGGSAKFFLFILFIFSIIVVVICIYGFTLPACIYSSINDAICYVYKLVYHLNDGTNNEIPDSNWKGFNKIIDLIEGYGNTQTKLNILTQKNIENECQDNQVKEICNLYKGIITFYDNYFLSLEESKNKTESFSELFFKLKNETLDDIENIMGYFDKYFKLGMFILFSVILAFCLFELLSLIAYFCYNCNCLGCLFHFFWNLEMLIIIIAILIGVVLGSVGVISKDTVSILQYAISFDNLKEEKPFLLDFKNESIYAIDTCFNGDGDLYSLLFNSIESYNNNIGNSLKNFQEKYSEFKERGLDTTQKTLTEAFEDLNQIINKTKDLNENLKNLNKIFDCQFFKKDFKVILDELKDNVAKKLTFFSMVIIIVGLVSVITIFLGISIINNYRRKNELLEQKSQDRHIKMQTKETKPNMNSSSDQLRK